MVDQAIQNFGDDFVDWIEDRGLNEKEETIWLFHYWIRKRTQDPQDDFSLQSGSIVDYRKYVAQYLNIEGELEDVPDDLSSHHNAAVNKFRDFKSSEFISKKDGDSE